jgi:DNA-binding winged helix-turn-helix (wHTH) protein
MLFPPFRLDPVNEQLWRDDTLLSLRPKPFAVLRYLVAHAGRLITREELQKAIWANTYISESLLRGYVRELREVLGDEAEAPRFIETIPRRGYRFLAALTTASPPVSSSKFLVSGSKAKNQKRETRNPAGGPQGWLLPCTRWPGSIATVRNPGQPKHKQR